MEIIVSGARPTGRLHLGHLHGALKNWIRLQENYRCYFFVADWHALTTDYATPQGIRQSTIEMVMDWLSVGLDPKRFPDFGLGEFVIAGRGSRLRERKVSLGQLRVALGQLARDGQYGLTIRVLAE